MTEDTQLTLARSRMPHTGKMQLIEEIGEITGQTIRCRSTGHVNAGYPLRVKGLLYTAALIELGAQAAAAHASIQAMGGAHSGLVLSISDVLILAPRVEDAELETVAVLTETMDGAAQYTFAVSGASKLIEGSLLLSMHMRLA